LPSLLQRFPPTSPQPEVDTVDTAGTVSTAAVISTTAFTAEAPAGTVALHITVDTAAGAGIVA
jgi:hypothetical protein